MQSPSESASSSTSLSMSALESLAEYMEVRQLSLDQLLLAPNHTDAEDGVDASQRRLAARLSNLSAADYELLLHGDLPAAELDYHLALSSTVTAYVLLATAVCGIVLNVFVFWQLGRIIRTKPYLNPAVVLRCMCAADIFCLVMLFSYTTVGESLMRTPHAPLLAKRMACKVFMYSVHVASAFSVWCWLALSAQRYIAIVRPLLYRRFSRIQRPAYVLVRLGALFVVIECWMFIITDYSPAIRDCREKPFMLLHTLQVLDIVVTYVLPVLSMLCMDASVRNSHARRVVIATQVSNAQVLEMNGLKSCSVRQTSTMKVDDENDAAGDGDDVSVESAPTRTTPCATSRSSAGLGGQPPETTGLSRVHSDKVPASTARQLSLLHQPPNKSAHGSQELIVTERREQQLQQQREAADENAEADGLTASSRLLEVGERPFPLSASQTEGLATSARRRQRERAAHTLRRYLLLSSLDIALNLPRILLRLLPVVAPAGPLLPPKFIHYLTLVSYLTYYAQHSINILYIWVLYPSLMHKSAPTRVAR